MDQEAIRGKGGSPDNPRKQKIEFREGQSEFAKLINQKLMEAGRTERWRELVGVDPERDEPLVIAEGIKTEEEMNRLEEIFLDIGFIPSNEFERRQLEDRRHQISFKIDKEVFNVLLEKRLFVQISKTTGHDSKAISNIRYILLDGEHPGSTEVMVSNGVEKDKLNFRLTFCEPKPFRPIIG